MIGWRLAVAGGLGLIVGLPLVPLFAGLRHASAWSWSPDDLSRVVVLAGHTLWFVAGSLALALPVGVLLALLLFRTRLPLRHVVLGLLALQLFIPLPLFVSAWQSFLGQGGLLPLDLWRSGAGRPWAVGWWPALWVQACASLPWVVFLVGLGLQGVEPELEEEALQLVSAGQVVRLVTLPRARPALLAAMLLVALSAAGDIGVTDMMQIDTLAEEVHTQFTLGQNDALERTVLLALPFLLSIWIFVLATTVYLERILPPLPALLRPAPPLAITSPAVGILCLGATIALGVVPFGSLLWKLGLAGTPTHWSLTHAGTGLANEATLYGHKLLQTLATALGTGLLVALIALLCCWLGKGSAWFRVFLLTLLTAAWVLPGPVVGIGLMQLILWLITQAPNGPWTLLLYQGPSPLPVIWVQTLRFLPIAVFFLWPVVRVLPTELREAARLEGARPWQELLFLVWPWSRRAVLLTALAVAALCLGEVAASTRVETPGWEHFGKLIFDRMHYGVDRSVAALCVLMLIGVAVAVLLGRLALWWLRRT